MLPFLKKNKGSIGVIVLVSMVSLIVNIFISYYTGSFIDCVSLQHSVPFLYRYMAVFGLLVVTDVLVKRFFLVYKAKVEEQAKFDIYREYIEHLNLIAIERFEKFNPTYLNQRLNTDIGAVCGFAFETLLDSVFSILKIGIILVIMVSFSWKAAAASVAMIVAYAIVFKVFVEPIRENNYQLKESSASYFQACNEQLTLYKEIRITSNYESSITHIRQKFSQYFKIMMGYVKVSVRYLITLEVVSMSFLILILFICGKGIIEGTMTVGTLFILNSYYTMLSGAIDNVCNAFKGYQETLNSVTRMEELLDIPEEENGEEVIASVERISLEDVGFAYENEYGFRLFDHLNLTFEKGKTYSILGNNGTGKTSLIYVMLALYRSNLSGTISINDKKETQVDVMHFRKNLVSVCMQNEKLPDMTVEEYLRFYGIEDMEKVYGLIRHYGMEAMYDSDTFHIKEYLSRNIRKLSGGEKQKVFFLRALAKEADVLVLDEINSNLDRESIGLLCEFITKLKEDKIILIISHNKKIVEVSDVKIQL